MTSGDDDFATSAARQDEYMRVREAELASLRAQLAEAEREAKAWSVLAEATCAINLPRAFFWCSPKTGRYLVRFAGGEASGDSFGAAAIALAESMGLLESAKPEVTK